MASVSVSSSLARSHRSHLSSQFRKLTPFAAFQFHRERATFTKCIYVLKSGHSENLSVNRVEGALEQISRCDFGRGDMF